MGCQYPSPGVKAPFGVSAKPSNRCTASSDPLIRASRSRVCSMVSHLWQHYLAPHLSPPDSHPNGMVQRVCRGPPPYREEGVKGWL
jgi:hypothetical protein